LGDWEIGREFDFRKITCYYSFYINENNSVERFPTVLPSKAGRWSGQVKQLTDPEAGRYLPDG